MADFITLSEAAREFGLSKSTLHNWVNVKKIIPASQPVANGKKFIKRADLVSLLTGKAEAAKKPRRRKSILFPRG